MNLFSMIDEPAPMRLFYFFLVLIPTIAVTLYTVLRSRRLSDFFETLADERLSSRAKLTAWANIWRRKQGTETDHPDGT
jgi:hypothetical protein